MYSARAILPILLAAVCACAPRTQPATPKPLVPQEGPAGSVRVLYDGGLFNRRAAASFRVDQSAYVMVAHLGGDGVIRVLFPTDGRNTGWVSSRQMYRTRVFNGDYDSAPNYWFMRPTMFRSAAARHYSYDGLGHGFVFMITSNRPLQFDRISDFGYWNELEVRDYTMTTDPRFAIRQYAEMLSGGARHSLEYATSFASTGLYSYAQARMDCAILSGGGFSLAPWMWGSGAYMWGSYASNAMPRCGTRDGRSSFAYWNHLGNPGPRVPVVGSAPVLPPVNIPAHRIPRPGRRDESAAGRSLSLTRTTLAQPTGSGERTWDRRAQQSPFGGHVPTTAEVSRPSSSPSGSSIPAASAPARPAGRQHERPVEVKTDP